MIVLDMKHLCPSGLRGCTQVALYSYSWVQIPLNAHDIVCNGYISGLTYITFTFFMQSSSHAILSEIKLQLPQTYFGYIYMNTYIAPFILSFIPSDPLP